MEASIGRKQSSVAELIGRLRDLADDLAVRVGASDAGQTEIVDTLRGIDESLATEVTRAIERERDQEVSQATHDMEVRALRAEDSLQAERGRSHSLIGRAEQAEHQRDVYAQKAGQLELLLDEVTHPTYSVKVGSRTVFTIEHVGSRAEAEWGKRHDDIGQP